MAFTLVSSLPKYKTKHGQRSESILGILASWLSSPSLQRLQGKLMLQEASLSGN